MSKPKRLIVACDGTWQNSDNGFERDSWLPWDRNGTLEIPTNVTRICRALLPETTNGGTQQITYYQAGLGSENNVWDHFVGGITGAGISENIREAFAFLAYNYEPGDEIFLLGFSRGAFTARSIAGLIASVGLLTRLGMVDFYPIFKDWENQLDDNYASPWPNKPFPKKPKSLNNLYVNELVKLGLTRLNVPIKAVGVWDTVGSLGIPNIGLLPVTRPPEYSFINTEVSPNIEYAYHALALDEHRMPYSPTIWEKPVGQTLPKILRQCWFPGVHANVGGSYPDEATADITLAWMMTQLEHLLEFDHKYMPWQRQLNLRYYENQNRPKIRPWGFGKLYNSLTGWYILGGSKIRTPGQYHATDPKTGKETSRLLTNTCEHIHPCVRVRIDGHGKGTQDHGHYNPWSLRGWKLLPPGKQIDQKDSVENSYEDRYKWVYRTKQGRLVVLPETVLSGIELQMKDVPQDV